MNTTPQLLQLNPAQLTTEKNVRKDLNLDKQFLDSIRTSGVLQPIVAYPDPINDGQYRIHMGHRRAAGAIDAGLELVPVYVITERDAMGQVAEQLSENIHRAGLTVTDQVGAYQEMALFGMSAMAIAKRTSSKLATVGDALKVAASTSVATVLEHAPDLDLTTLAQIAEFDDNKAALKKLTDTATNNPASLAHVIADLRKKKALADDVDTRIEELKAAGIQVGKLDHQHSHPDGLLRVGDLVHPDAPADDIDISDLTVVSEIPGISAGVAVGWDNSGGAYEERAVVVFFVAADADHGFVEKWAARREVNSPDPEERKAQEAEWAAQRDARAKLEAARTAATGVRLEWVKTLLQRPKLPDDVATLITRAVIVGVFVAEYYSDIEDERIFELLGEPVPERPDEGYAYVFKEALQTMVTANPRRTNHILLALVIAGIERDVQESAELGSIYLTTLQAWGYGLSEYEQTVVDKALAADEDDAA